MSVEIVQSDIDILRTLESRKSILNFTEVELAATEKWAKKFQGELSEKSPFYRLINGDWRENDESRVPIIDVANKSTTFQSVRDDIKRQVIFRGSVINSDTDWNIQISRKGLEETVKYAFNSKNYTAYNLLYHIEDIIKSGVLLDSVICEKNNNSKSYKPAFMHKMYAACRLNNNVFIAKLTIEDFFDGKDNTLKRLYNAQDIKLEPLRHIEFTEKPLARSVLNGSNISISDLFQIVKSFDKDFYLNKRSEKQIEKFPDGESERNDNMAEQDSLLLERIAALEKQVAAMSAEQRNLKEQINTVNQFISSIAESQNFEQSMATIESMGKQVLDCQKAEFWCYDGAENKYFSNDENRGGRDWQIAKENMRIAAESKKAYIADGAAYVPIISNDKVAGILIASEKTGEFDKASLEKFAPNGQIANTIDLSLKKEFEHQGRITDELTRLKNRQGAKEYAANTMAHNANAKKDMCIIMCDIDHFKSINDTYGHDAGDTVLKNVAGILQSGTRQGADAAFRWGGEEMVCVLNCDYEHAMDIAERLRQQIENTQHLVYNADKQPMTVGVTISMGVHQITPDKEITQENAFSFFENQLKFADELAYKAKETGRNKVVGENDIMIEKNTEKENYSIFCIENGGETAYFRDNNTNIDAFMQRLADCNGNYPEFLKGCTEISEVEFAELEQMGKPIPTFCSRINLDTVDITGEMKPKELSIWDNEKTATVNLDEAIQSVKANGSAELEFIPFASDDYEIESKEFNINEESDPDYYEIQEQAIKEFQEEYFELSESLDVIYNDFLYHNGIHNDESIKFEDKNGQLPDNLDTAENRELVKEYIDGQLKNGNISDVQKETLEELKNMISDVENAERNADAWNKECQDISEWCDAASEIAAERNAEYEKEENSRNNNEAR